MSDIAAGKLNEVARLAALLVAAENDVAEIEFKLKARKEDARRLAEESLPSAMEEIGLSEVKLTTGEKIKVGLEVYASIPAATKEAAFAWLTDNGHDGLIKTEVAVEFGRGLLNDAMVLLEKLRTTGVEATLSRNVHPQTLKAFLKEQLQQAKGVPLDVFGARPVMLAKVTRAKN